MKMKFLAPYYIVLFLFPMMTFSERRKVVLQSSPGYGKTWICQGVSFNLTLYGVPVIGYYTEYVQNEKGQRIGKNLFYLPEDAFNPAPGIPILRHESYYRSRNRSVDDITLFPRIAMWRFDIQTFQEATRPVFDNRTNFHLFIADEIHIYTEQAHYWRQRLKTVFSVDGAMVLATMDHMTPASPDLHLVYWRDDTVFFNVEIIGAELVLHTLCEGYRREYEKILRGDPRSSIERHI